jgi:hypothetical protein
MMFDAIDTDGGGMFVTGDVVGEDRRRGMSSSGRGRAMFLKNMAGLQSVGARRGPTEVLATRGERHALVRATFEFPSEFAADVLVCLELDDGGLLASYVVYDPDAIDEAFRDLDEAYACGEAAAFADVVRLTSHALEPFNRRDWRGYRAMLGLNTEIVDHQQLGIGVLGPDEIIDYARALTELAPDIIDRTVSYAAIDRRGAVIRQRVAGHNREGGAVEFEMLYLLFGDDRRQVLEIFPLDRRDDALRRFWELAAQI